MEMKPVFCAVAGAALLLSGLSAQAQQSYDLGQAHTGEGTFYGYGGGGNCSYPVPAMLTAAMNHTDYAGSEVCGACIEVTNLQTAKSVVVRIDDQCPECKPGDVDLSESAFVQIAERQAGRIPISWKYVSCSAPTMQMYFKEGSSQYWTAVQVRDQRYPVKSLAYRPAGSGQAYKELPRETYNYFTEAAGMGPGPYDFKLTDVFGQVVEAKKIGFAVTTPIIINQQFPTVSSSGSSSSGSSSGGGTVVLPATAKLNINNDWGSGYCGTLDVTNPNASGLQWKVDVTVSGTVSSLWNGLYAQSGSTLTVWGANTNAYLAAGATTQIGLCANR